MKLAFVFPVLLTCGMVALTTQPVIPQAQIRVKPNGQMECINAASGVFIGEGAGAGDGILYTRNVFIGKKAGFVNGTGFDNVAIGFEAAMSNTTGTGLTALGTEALRSNVNGTQNVAIGNQSMLDNSSGSQNVAVGYLSLQQNQTGSLNVAIGPYALQNAQQSTGNIAIGTNALHGTESGSFNIGIGYETMPFLTSGYENVAMGTFALRSATSAINNVAIGTEALRSNNLGMNIVALGHQAGFGDWQSSNANVYIGSRAGSRTTLNSVTKSNNVMIGYEAGFMATGSGNVFIGYQAGNGSVLSNRLFIDNSSTNSPLVFGNFATDELEINGQLFLDNPTSAIQLSMDLNQLRFKKGQDMLLTERNVMRFLLDTDNDQSGASGQSRVQFFSNVDTSGSLTPPVNFNLDGGDSWINSGSLGIGVTDPVYKLDVAGTIDASSGLSGGQTALRAQGAEAVWFNGTQFSWGFGGTWNRFADSVRIGTNVSPSHLLQVDGIARSTQSTWATSSDARVKENIKNIGDAVNTLKQFRPVTFTWSENYRADHPELKDMNYGFISQEVEQIIPSMVTQVKEKIGDTTIGDFRVLNTDALVPLLVSAMQEQQVQIERLQTRISEFEELIKRIEPLLHKAVESNEAGIMNTKTP